MQITSLRVSALRFGSPGVLHHVIVGSPSDFTSLRVHKFARILVESGECCKQAGAACLHILCSWTYPFRWCVGCDSMAMLLCEVIKENSKVCMKAYGGVKLHSVSAVGRRLGGP